MDGVLLVDSDVTASVRVSLPVGSTVLSLLVLLGSVEMYEIWDTWVAILDKSIIPTVDVVQ